MAGTTGITPFSDNDEQGAIFSKTTDLFKRVNGSWQFFFRNSENIKDVEPLRFDNNEGMFIISDSKITKWTNLVPTKRIYLKVRDRAGNDSLLTNTCSIYSLNLEAIKDFLPSGRILDVDEYGAIQYSFDSPDDRLFYGGDLIDQEIGTYESEIFNGTNNLVMWRSVMWDSTEPTGTSIAVQIRSGATEDAILDADWSDDLVRVNNFVNIEYIQDQFVQYRAILTSRTRGISPSLHNLSIRNLTAASSHFFTTNFVLPSRVISGVMTDNSIVPVTADIVFGISTNNSVDFTEYQIIDPNRVFTTNSRQFGEQLRIGVKFLSPGWASPTSDDPYENVSHSCRIAFTFTNTDSSTKTFQFRVLFYSDWQRTQLAYTFFSGNDQTGWQFGNSDFPAAGISIAADEQRSLVLVPGDAVAGSQIYYLTIEAFDGSSYENVLLNDSYVCATSDPYDPYAALTVPRLQNMALIFSMESGEVVKINM